MVRRGGRASLLRRLLAPAAILALAGTSAGAVGEFDATAAPGAPDAQPAPQAVAAPVPAPNGESRSHDSEAKEVADKQAEGEKAEGEKAEGEEAGEPSEEAFTPVDVDAACMLIGGVSFVILIFWLVHVQDDDVRRYAWKVISNTICIFLAVLFFKGNNEMLTKCFGESSELLTLLLRAAHCCLYLAVLLLAIGKAAGVWEEPRPNLEAEAWTIADAMLVRYEEEVPKEQVRAHLNGDTEATKSVTFDEHGMEVAVTKKKLNLEARIRDSKCWGALLAHMAGFAAISMGGALQQSEFFRASPLRAFLPVVLTAAFLMLMFRGSLVIRARLKEEAKRMNRVGLRARLVSQTVGEAENDILALAMSFLLVQSLRFALTGQLPSEEGMETAAFQIGLHHLLSLLAIGGGFALASMGVAFLSMRLGEEDGEADDAPLLARACDVLLNTFAMCFAWCMMYSARWAWMRYDVLGMHVGSIDARILLALALSLVSFVLISGLDAIDDLMRAEGRADTSARAIASIVGAISVLVGFSWEHSFDGAVTAIADLNHAHPKTSKFVLGLSVFAFLLRPWSLYILRRAMQLEELKIQRQKFGQKRRTLRAVDTEAHHEQKERLIMEIVSRV